MSNLAEQRFLLFFWRHTCSTERERTHAEQVHEGKEHLDAVADSLGLSFPLSSVMSTHWGWHSSPEQWSQRQPVRDEKMGVERLQEMQERQCHELCGCLPRMYLFLPSRTTYSVFTSKSSESYWVEPLLPILWMVIGSETLDLSLLVQVIPQVNHIDATDSSPYDFSEGS